MHVINVIVGYSIVTSEWLKKDWSFHKICLYFTSRMFKVNIVEGLFHILLCFKVNAAVSCFKSEAFVGLVILS